MKYLLTIVVAVILLGGNGIAWGASHSAVGRYVQVTNEPLFSQTQLLDQLFDVHFPYEVQTIGNAMHYLLNNSGYQLVELGALDTTVQHLLTLPLPDVDRHLGPMTLLQGLETLAGQPFQVVIDPVHRLIAFRLKATFQHQYGVAS